MKDTSRNIVELHPIIDQVVFNVSVHEYNVSIYEDMLEWKNADKESIEFSDDESEINQNFIGLRDVGEEDEDYIHNELRYHQEELDKQRTLLRIYMDAFNGGWIF